MIEIKITDPHLMPLDSLRHTAKYLLALAGDELCATPEIDPPTQKTVYPTYRAGDTISIKKGVSEVHDVLTGQAESEVETLNKTAPIAMAQARAVDRALQKHGDIMPENPDLFVDTSGAFWNPEIHTRTRSKTPDGKWKLKVGTTNIPKPPIPTAPTAEPAFIPPAMATMDFPQFVNKITTLVSSGKMTHPEIATIVQSFDNITVPDLSKYPELVPQVSAKIDEYLENK